MEQNIPTNVSKDQIISHIQDMCELESREFTLRKMAENRRRYAEKLRDDCIKAEPEHQKIVDEHETWLQICKEELYDNGYDISIPEERISGDIKWKYYRDDFYNGNKASTDLFSTEHFIRVLKNQYNYNCEEISFPPAPTPPIKPDTYKGDRKELKRGVDMWRLFLGCALSFVFFCLAVSGDLREAPSWLAIFAVCVFIAGFVFFYMHIIASIQDKRFCDENNALKRSDDEYDEKLKQYNNQMVWYQKYVRAFYMVEVVRLNKESTIKSSKKRLEEDIPATLRQVELLEGYADQIKECKDKIYSVDIIPPDYRTLDCVVMLNSIFRNDLADTIREAVLLYDERVFRGEVIKGVAKIYEMLGQLAYSMKVIEDRLIEIRDSVRTMCFELNRNNRTLQDISMAIDSQKNVQEQILGETAAARYVMESVERSNELLLLHQNQQRGTYYQ